VLPQRYTPSCDDGHAQQSPQAIVRTVRANSGWFIVVNSKTIRVAWLAPYPPEFLQPELTIVRSPKAHPASWIVNLANALAKRDDVDLQVITASSGILENQTVTKERITFHVIRHTFPFTARGFPAYMRLDVLTRYAFLRRQVRQILLRLQPDVIHVHGTEYGYGLAALEANTLTIVSIQGIVNLLARVSPSLFYRRQAPFELHVIRTAKYFGSRTAWADSFIRNLNDTATIYDLPEAVDPVFFRMAAAQTNPHILMVGSVLQRKGIEEALRAMSIVVAACPSAKLLVVGEGRPDYLEGLKQHTKSAGIKANVEWLGFKTAHEIAALHAVSAILIHPSYLDNSPNSVAEAMASGLPIIASNVGGIPSMIENGVTGLLVEPRNPRQLAEAIIALLQNEAERKRLARRAKEVACERHLPSKVAEKTLSVYKDIIAKEKRG
jgi:glycosyltransferase involved in cell wall biosynthesis